jgi:hypothetical protein
MQENTSQQISIQDDDEITLKDIIVKVMTYYRLVLRKWYIVILLSGVLAGFFLYQAYKTKPVYKAVLTFMLNDAQGSAMGVSSLLGQFGLGSGNTGMANLDKIVEISKSHRILKTALFTKTALDGQSDFFANHFIRILEFKKMWKKDTTGLATFEGFKSDNFENFSRLENKVLFTLLNKLIGKDKPLLASSYEKKSTILTMALSSPHEELSIGFVKTIFAHLSEFYVLKSTERERQNYDIIRAQKDSLYNIMRSKEIGAARFEDKNQGLIFQTDKVQGSLMRKDAQIAGLAYGEILKNFAVADYALKNNTPFIQEIDIPYPPIKPVRKSKLMAIITGGALGVFLSLIWIIGGSIIGNAIREAKG